MVVFSQGKSAKQPAPANMFGAPYYHDHSVSSVLHSRRSALKLAGGLTIIGIVVAVAIDMRSGAAQSLSGEPPATTSATSLTVSSDASNPSVDTLGAPSPSATGSANSLSTTVDSSTTNSNGVVSTQLTVNGQPVPVPANGSSQQTVTSPASQTTITTSSNQTNAGTAHNSTSLHIYTSTNSNVNQEDIVTH